MPTVNLNGLFFFDVLFELASKQLTLIPQVSLPSSELLSFKGYFKIKQPDCLTRTGNFTTPDVAYDSNTSALNSFSIPLRMGSDGQHQRGIYEITFFASLDGYNPGEYAHKFDFRFITPILKLTDHFNCFAPSLSYTDESSYLAAGFNITSQSNSWLSNSVAGTKTSTLTTIDLAISGNYYDNLYTIKFTKVLSYQGILESWLKVTHTLTGTVEKAAFIPASMATLLTYLLALKDQGVDGCGCPCDDQLFDKASNYYQLLRARVCLQNTDGLSEMFAHFYRLTHNYITQEYTNTNQVIPPYDYTTGCGSNTSGGSSNTGTTTAVVVEGIVGGAIVITGTTSSVTGISNGSSGVTCAAFANMRVRVIRGNAPIPSIDPGDGSYFITKILAATTVNFNTPLNNGEYLRLETIT